MPVKIKQEWNLNNVNLAQVFNQTCDERANKDKTCTYVIRVLARHFNKHLSY